MPEAVGAKGPGSGTQGPASQPGKSAGKSAGASGDVAPGAMTEYLTDEWAFFIRSAREFEKFRSPYQAVEVHDSVPFGKLFRLDGNPRKLWMLVYDDADNLVYPPLPLLWGKPRKEKI